jgi:YHS domain-containing protein
MGRLLGYVLELLLLFLLAEVLRRTLRQLFGTTRIHFWSTPGAPGRDSASETRRGETARDPICGMFVSTELSHQLTQGTQTLHFCSRECLERYQKDLENAHK